MKTHITIMLFCLMTSVCVMAESISFVDVSKQLSNNEQLASPIYTKQVYRQMYEEDKIAYNRRMRALDNQKKEGKISSRDYLQKTEALKNTFKKAYPHTLAEQGKHIEKNPVAMWNIATFSNHRRHLIRLTHPEYQQIMKDTIAGKNITVSKDDTQTTPSNNSPQTTTPQIIKIKNTQKLGRKSFSINTDSFK